MSSRYIKRFFILLSIMSLVFLILFILLLSHLRADCSANVIEIKERKYKSNIELSQLINHWKNLTEKENVPNIEPNQTGLVELARKLIQEPRPYVTKFSLPLVQTPQAKEVDILLNKKSNGFFVECGALDGERSSNTIWLESERKWNGLLIEMDPSYYMQLRGKNRKSYSIQACLSPQDYPIYVYFKEHAMGQGKLLEKTEKNKENVYETFCFPFYTLMLAMNISTIDYFSLDVEGMEVPILKTIPFDKLDIKILSVEYVHGKGGEAEYINFMTSKGYKVHKKINYVKKEIYLGVNDFIFVKE